MENTQKAIELIEKSEHILVLLPPDPTLDCLAAAEVLTRALAARGISVGFLAPSLPEHTHTKELFPHLAAVPAPLKEYIISVDTKDAPISELRYENNGTALDIILSPKSAPIKKEAVSFRDGNILCECVIALALPTIDAAECPSFLNPEFFTTTPIVAIDTNREHTQYGDANLIPSGDKHYASLCEIVYEFLSRFSPNALDAESATLLLLGIENATDMLRAPSARAETFLAVSELLRLGARRMNVHEYENAPPLPFLQLYGRALVRSKIDSERNFAWSFLTAEDFQKTGRSTDDITAAAQHLLRTFCSQNLFILLWEHPEQKTISALFAGNEKILAAIQEQHEAERDASCLFLGRSFETFHAAEREISSLLQDAL